jgi:hypothetical protein
LYVELVISLLKYEDNNLEYYAESDANKKLATNPAGSDFRMNFDTTFNSWRNPFKDAYFWLKGEILDLKGLNDTLIGREQVLKQ